MYHDVSKDSFQRMPTDSKLDVLFDQNERLGHDICDIKIQLRKHRMYNRVWSAVGGVCGGIMTVVGMCVGKLFLH